MYGYIGKILFVNLSTNEFEVRDLAEQDARNFLGGPGLGAKILYDEMPANTDVFGEDSVIGYVTGPLNATKALFGGRYTVVCKSPVTGGWNDANSGGFFGPDLKKSGYDGIFVKGISEKPVYLFIDDGKTEILDAADLWGLTTQAVEKTLKAKHGDKINIALIGPAGENLSYMAAIMNDEHRAAGRGGCGAVMGSKKLKAIVVRGTHSVTMHDKDKVVAINKEIVAFMKGPALAATSDFGAYGTGGTYVTSCMIGDASVKNWSGSGVTDYPEELAFPISSPGIEPTKIKKYYCSNCAMGCGSIHNYPSERWDLSHSSRPEYETMGMFGSQMLNSDVASIFRANDLCNEYGVDTISTGGTVAWAMECYETGVLSKEELDGIELTWGNFEAIIAMTEKIIKNEGVGKILAKGSQAAANEFGKGFECLVTASGIEEPQHDSRLAYGLTRTYQYDPTPGRHVKGGIGMRVYHKFGDSRDYVGTGYKDLMGVCNQEICNSSGYCLFGMAMTPPGVIIRLVSAVTGFEYSPPEIVALGTRMYTMRHAFNVREGFRRKDYTLSKRMTESKPPFDGPLADMKIDNELLADNFFNTIGWDLDTVPLQQSLKNVGGLENVIRDLYPPVG